eukprot:CAMPEP_0179854836 /NCGR_PEP_ID=MMETSP0982-20121206/10178_1 /TAXON_ID=483367 /ORGANISM="non described non described, Strain CCMP 2436" /LENGTH=73 /DNA_ID=CAMNT_0021740813 /DNA_START=269 /DNA_END=487 /DNA_ORIENTATION=+
MPVRQFHSKADLQLQRAAVLVCVAQLLEVPSRGSTVAGGFATHEAVLVRVPQHLEVLLLGSTVAGVAIPRAAV